MTTRTILFLSWLLCAPLISQGADSDSPAAEGQVPSSKQPSPFPAGFTAPPDQAEGWTAVPAGRPFSPLVPDPRDLKTALRKDSQNQLEADVGAYHSFAGWKGDIAGEESILHIGMEGNAYFQMGHEGSKFPLYSSDGLIGLYGEAIRGMWMYQLRYTHISAHLSDGLYNERARIVYTRETASLRVARQIGFTRVYAGYHFLAHTIPILPRSSGQLGFYSIFPWHWKAVHPYVGADVRIRSSQEGTTMNLTAGAAIVSSNNTPTVRLMVAYQKGNDQRGQFYDDPLEKWDGGIELDF